MGNSNSQPLVSRLAPSLLQSHQQKDNRGKKQSKVVQSPQNRVLPDVSSTQQRLRCTNNGNILQNGGTISGRKTIVAALPDSEPEFLRLLQAKCQAARSSPENASFQALYGHKKSHSDPDIVRRMMMCDNESDCEEDDQDDRFHSESMENTKSIIAVSPSKAKIKSRKKKRAPEPPHSNTLPRSLDRMAVVYNSDNMLSYKKKEFGDPPRRPLPPIPTDEPPPPPPPPDYNRDPEGQIIVKVPSKNYEKNRRVVDKWKFSKTPPEGISDDRHRQRSKSLDRTEDQRLKESNENHSRFERNLSLKNLSNRDVVDSSPVQRHINKISDSDLKEAIAKMGKEKSLWDGTRYHGNTQLKSNKDFCNPRKHESGNCYNVKQYYFSGPHEDRRNSPNEDMLNCVELRNSQAKERTENSKTNTSNKRRSYLQRKERDSSIPTPREKPHQEIISNQKRRHHQRIEDDIDMCTTQSKWNFFPHDSSHQVTPRKAPSMSSSSTDGEIEIDLQLRPTLPRKPLEITKFSPTDAWRSINLDFLKPDSQRSDISSDEGDDVMEDKVNRIHRPVAPRRVTHHRSADSGISPDAGSPMFINDSFEALLNSIPASGAPPVVGASENRNAWIPQHDLADECDTDSETSVPKIAIAGPPQEVQAKFSLPNLMFPSKSLPRTENVVDIVEKTSHTHEKVRRRRSKGARKQSYKSPEGQHFNSLRNLKKVLGIKSKTLANDEAKGLDANWSLSQSLPNFANNLNIEQNGRKTDAAQKSYLENSRKYGSDARVSINGCGRMTTDTYAVNSLQNRQNCGASWGNGFVGQSSEGHVIYLPEYSSPGVAAHNANVSGDEIQVNTDSELVVKKRTGRKKFSYQSTMRQIEKKKLEEQVAREVEEREKKRQQEIEWMNKVEDEFRKQRDKEKVNIRHQLRILHLQNKSCGPTAKDVHRNGDSTSCCQDNVEAKKFVKNHPWDGENVSDGKFWANSSPTTDQQQPTGMRKWLRRQNREHSFKHPRPEPEGGRSSSDDGKQTANQNVKCSERIPNNRLNVNNTNWLQHASGNFQSNHVSSSPCVNGGCEITKSLSSPNIPSCNENSERLRHIKPQNCDQQKLTNGEETFRGVDEDNFVDDSVEEYELHMKLSRTNSGRTFESHSYYVRAEDRKRDDPSSHNFRRDRMKATTNSGSVPSSIYKEHVKRRAREFERRSQVHAARSATASDNDETGSDEADRVRERPQGCLRGQRSESQQQQLREPSFSRNHPHRKGKLQINGRIGQNGSANLCVPNGISSIHA